MRKYLKEVENRIIALTPTVPPKWKLEDYIGGGESRLRYLNIKIPRVREAFKKPFSFSSFPPEQQWRIWDYIWRKSPIFEVMLGASYWAASRPIDEVVQNRKLILAWLTKVDNWAHSDELSAHYARMLEHDPKFLSVFEKWNLSKKPWFKRQSMVGLLFYCRFRKRTPKVNVLLSFIERHLDDEHYYVQKGVGWALREAWNVFPQPTYAFMKKNARRIPAAGWTAATEKLKPSDKAFLKSLRKT